MRTLLKAYHYGHLSFQLRQGHRYPLPRYAWLRQVVLDSGLFFPEHVIAGEPVGDQVLLWGHSADYIAQTTTRQFSAAELRLLNLPNHPSVFQRARAIVGSTLAAAQSALIDRVSLVLGGGTHHAHRTYGSGFCVFNDIACAARYLLAEGAIGRVAVFDCDVHQGDGTATILAADSATFTCSIHAAANFPFVKAISDLDIGLPTGTDDAPYLAAVQGALTQTLASQPDLLFYVAGADPFMGDQLGKLAISADALAARDRMVLTACIQRHLPVVVLLGGGYAQPLRTVVDLNMQTIEIGCDLVAQLQNNVARNVAAA
jgi:acetoin utilization deacetylase AcuC-like enzyme